MNLAPSMFLKNDMISLFVPVSVCHTVFIDLRMDGHPGHCEMLPKTSLQDAGLDSFQ